MTMGIASIGSGYFVTFQSLIAIKYMGLADFPATFGAAAVITGLCFPLSGSLVGKYYNAMFIRGEGI